MAEQVVSHLDHLGTEHGGGGQAFEGVVAGLIVNGVDEGLQTARRPVDGSARPGNVSSTREDG
ncbi:MAG: hypothetical protein ACRDY5_09030 [Acidimicrobiales bacterium]